MKLLIAIKSCRRDWMRGDHDVIRSTWGKDVPEGIDLRFFIGIGSGGTVLDRRDEVILDVGDEYDHLPQKAKAIFKWALDRSYDYIFLADTDTFVIPSRLIALPFQDYDLAGRFGKIKPIGETFKYVDGRDIVYDPCWPWPSGGCGYFVSARGAQYIVETPCSGWAEDMQSGYALGPLEKQGLVKIGDLEDLECKASWHFPRWKYGNEVYHPRFGWMEKMQKEHGETKTISAI